MSENGRSDARFEELSEKLDAALSVNDHNKVAQTIRQAEDDVQTARRLVLRATTRAQRGGPDSLATLHRALQHLVQRA